MEINKFQINNSYKNQLQPKEYRKGFRLQQDSVSFSSTSKKTKISFLDRLKNFFNNTTTNNTYYSSVYKGFEEHFFKSQNSIIQEITLTQKQKNILNKKISAFEKYKSSPNSSQLTELEKNKHSILDFSLKDGLPDRNLKGYKNFLNRYETFKNGDFSGITNEELAQLLYYTDTTDLISDKKIGSFAQGRTGDCWFLSMLGNYASTREGEKNIANRISKPDENGTYTVTFDDPFKNDIKREYKVTQKDLQNYDLLNIDSRFSSGDLDVRILEVATGKMLNDYILQMDKFSYYKEKDDYIFAPFLESEKEYCPSTSIAEGFLEKRLLVHRSLGYKSNIIQYVFRPPILPEHHTLKDYATQEYIDNTEAKIYSIEMTLQEKNGSFEFIPIVKTTEHQTLSDVIEKNAIKASELTVESSDVEYSSNEKENRYISTGHSYNLMNLNSDRSLTVNDPYNSAFPHTISRENFERVFDKITYVPNN